MSRCRSRRAAFVQIHTPGVNQATIILTPGQRGPTGIPILPGAGPRTRRWPVLVFPGLSLGLGRVPRYVGGRKNSKASGKAEASAGVEAVHGAKVERVGPKDGGG